MKLTISLVGVAIGAALLWSRGSDPVVTHDPHGEWVRYENPAGDTVSAYIAFPERPDAAPAVLVIHEIFGMSDWVAAVADTLAMQGFVAIAPDFLSRHGGTAAAGENARRLNSELTPVQVNDDLDGAFAYLRALPSVLDDAIGVIGFCWGGGRSFDYATHNPQLRAAVVCYGPSASRERMAHIQASVLGVYAENDARINAGLPAADSAMREYGKRFRHTIYPGTGHGFLRRGEPAAEVTRGWTDIFAFLRTELAN
jgi:carboxymethylenebutenolidase